VPLNWVSELKGPDWQNPYRPASPTESVTKPGGAYHIVSDQPIVAYQFNPLEGSVAASPGCPSTSAGDGHCYSYSSDASLLLPSHVLSSRYIATGYHALHQDASSMTSNNWGKLDMGDFVTITATQPNTVVWLSPRPTQSLLAWPDAPHLMPGQPAVFSMGAGQVAQIFTPGTSLDETLSGSDIFSEGKPIQVLSGVACASVPFDPAHCGHMEDQVLPIETLGKDYVVPSLYDASGSRIAHTVRVQAISDATAVTFEPTMLTGVTLARGEVVEIPNVQGDVRVSSSVPFGVTQFVNSRSKQSQNDLALGGPSQITLAPSSQFRTKHSFAASPLYDANFVSVTAPTGAMVSLDGQPIAPEIFMAVGASGMSVARVALTKNDRVHVVVADKPVGVLVYGFAPYASYAYAGSLDLRRTPPTP
jgi:hypothetical protein